MTFNPQAVSYAQLNTTRRESIHRNMNSDAGHGSCVFCHTLKWLKPRHSESLLVQDVQRPARWSEAGISGHVASQAEQVPCRHKPCNVRISKKPKLP